MKRFKQRGDIEVEPLKEDQEDLPHDRSDVSRQLHDVTHDIVLVPAIKNCAIY